MRELSLLLHFGPDAAVLAVALGVLAIEVEFCRPGSAVPGALGSSLVLLGLASLLRFPIAFSALLAMLLAAALLVVEAIARPRGLFTLLAAVAMSFGLRNLIEVPDSATRVGWAAAVCAALPVTLATGFLVRGAAAARRLKMLPRAALRGETIS